MSHLPEEAGVEQKTKIEHVKKIITFYLMLTHEYKTQLSGGFTLSQPQISQQC